MVTHTKVKTVPKKMRHIKKVAINKNSTKLKLGQKVVHMSMLNDQKNQHDCIKIADFP